MYYTYNVYVYDNTKERVLNLTSHYVVIGTEQVQETANFYRQHFGFETSFEADWYISLVRPGERPYELAVLDYTHTTVPAAFRKPAQGVILNFEVEDVDAEYARLKVAGLPIHLDIRSEDFGQRHFITSDPAGLLIDLIQPIPPAGKFVEQFVER